MKRWMQIGAWIVGLAFSYPALNAQELIQTYPNFLSGGPEIYSLQRDNEGGASQQGMMYGVRIGIDHIKRHRLYWGFEFSWAQGDLTGKLKLREEACGGSSDSTSNHLTVKSCFTDINFEERLGFTFQTRNDYCFTLTPYIGLGRFWEYNHYKQPKELSFHFDNNFLYIPVGFLSQIFIFPNFSLGLNFKVRVLLNGKQYVSNDSQYPDHEICYDEKLHYRGELPISYYFKWNCYPLAVSLVPFYEFREYGARVNFPQDFHRTRYQLYGATGKLLFLF